MVRGCDFFRVKSIYPWPSFSEADALRVFQADDKMLERPAQNASPPPDTEDITCPPNMDISSLYQLSFDPRPHCIILGLASGGCRRIV